MNENNRPKRPEEILAALSAEGNRIEQLTKEIDEKMWKLIESWNIAN